MFTEPKSIPIMIFPLLSMLSIAYEGFSGAAHKYNKLEVFFNVSIFVISLVFNRYVWYTTAHLCKQMV